jgi:hypothetical protein
LITLRLPERGAHPQQWVLVYTGPDSEHLTKFCGRLVMPPEDAAELERMVSGAPRSDDGAGVEADGD